MMFRSIQKIISSSTDRFGIKRFLGPRRAPLWARALSEPQQRFGRAHQWALTGPHDEFGRAPLWAGLQHGFCRFGSQATPPYSPPEVLKTVMWWDVDSCPLPPTYDARYLGPNIRQALERMNFKGHLTIHAFGNTNLVDESKLLQLSSTGIYLHHIPRGNKESAHKKIIVDLMSYALDNGMDTNIMLVSGHRDYSDCLPKLAARRFTVLLAQPEEHATKSSIFAAKYVWIWSRLLAGEGALTETEMSELYSKAK
ncbi:PREDICTED: uncharacterized protein LOC104788379 [Camelina sativa]|uniref:Uncharacterized protein LOC104788379 n=1 Tax=Camelina sativa TaxID=90675 RepID=A0ABM0Z9Q2_CAMSA|nr:PREDICTED: uncharacterized protein LOC104788379 [Camelina sativa]